MTDEAVSAPAQDAVQPSQVLNDTGTDPNAQGKGVHIPEAEQPKQDKPLSTRDAIAKAFDENEKAAKDKAQAAADDAKAKADEVKAADRQDKPVDEKPAKARADDGKFAKAETDKAPEADKGAPEKAATGQDGSERRQSEGRQYQEPPARFLPEARTKWANVPNEVKAEFHRVSQEMETELAKHKEGSERYESFRQYDDIAKSNGRDLAQVFNKVVRFEQAFQQNAPAAFDMLLREMGARKPDGSPLSFVEFATDIARRAAANPQAFQQTQMQSAPQQRQADPEIMSLKQEIQSMRAEQATQAVVPVVTQFASAHPDFNDLFPQIKAILESKVIEGMYGNGLSHEQKLAEAYRMAGGKGAPSQSAIAQDAPEHSAPQKARLVDPDGQNSIRGAPTAGQTGQAQWKPKTNREALERAFADARH